MKNNKSSEHKELSDSLPTRKSSYQRMMITPIEFVPEYGILAGSVTNHDIIIEDVTVAEFTDDSFFPTDGFEVNFDTDVFEVNFE